MVEWLGLHISTAGRKGLTPGWGTKIPQAIQCSKKINKKFFKKKELAQPSATFLQMTEALGRLALAC